MSDDTAKLLERIAALEARHSTASKPAEGTGFDKKRMTLDPINYLREQGIDIEHIGRHFVANALGKDCPPQLSAMVQMGPQIAAQSQLSEQLAALSRKVDELTSKTSAASLKNQTVDPAKYPTLAAAVKADSSILERELAKIGDVADPAKAFEKIESNLAPYAKAFGFKPTTGSAQDSHSTTSIHNPDGSPVSSEIRPASALSGEVPSLLGHASTGAVTADEHERLKSAVLKKYNLPE